MDQGEQVSENHLKLLDVKKETKINVKFYKEKET